MSRHPLRTTTTAAALTMLVAGLASCSPGSTVVSATTPPPLGAATTSPETADPAPETPSPPSTPSSTGPHLPTPSSSGGPIHTVPGKIAPNDDGRKAAPDGSTWKLKVVDGEVPVDSWPKAEDLLSDAELKAIFPDAHSIKVQGCRDSDHFGAGGSTTKYQSSCEIVVVMPHDSSSVPSRLNVRISGFGPRQEMVDNWDRITDIYERVAKKQPDAVTFYEDGAFGAAKVFSTGVTTRVLLANDEVAGNLSIGVIGFFHLNGERADYQGSKQTFQEQIMPLIIKTLAAHMP